LNEQSQELDLQSLEVSAQRHRRGGIEVFVASIPIGELGHCLPVPDPSHKFPGNRTVDRAHAESFADYWMSNPRWATPPLLLDTTSELADSFMVVGNVGEVDLGKLRIPSNAYGVLAILDGQHRILGWDIAAKRIAAALSSSQKAIEQAHVLGDTHAMAVAQDAQSTHQALARRLATEHITAEIYQGVPGDEHRQFFSDIATNAKGITKSTTAAFDQRELVNRVAAALAASHPLIEGAVDFEKDRTVGASEKLISAKNLGDIIRACCVGFDSRASRRVEQTLDADQVTSVTTRFLDVLSGDVPNVARVAVGDMTAAQFRATSLAASPTVLRCLAGAFRIMCVERSDSGSVAVIVDRELDFHYLLRDLRESWEFPLSSVWLDTGYFPHAASRAPSSRSQDLRGLTLKFAEWAQQGVPDS